MKYIAEHFKTYTSLLVTGILKIFFCNSIWKNDFQPRGFHVFFFFPQKILIRAKKLIFVDKNLD